MKAGQREIFYLSAPSRQLAENSPYYENLKKAETEVILSYISSSFSNRETWSFKLPTLIIVQQVLFCYEPYDELVLMQLQQFDKKTVTSVEKEMRSGPAEETVVTDETLELKEQTELTDWVKVNT